VVNPDLLVTRAGHVVYEIDSAGPVANCTKNLFLTVPVGYGILQASIFGAIMARLRIMVGVAGVMMTAWLAVAQNGAAGARTNEAISNGSLIHTLVAAPVIGQPYSAVQVHRTVRKLADGTTISHQGHHGVARDAEGRVRVEMRMAQGQNGGPDTVMVFVLDPVAHTFTTWTTGPKAIKTASVVKLPAERNSRAAQARVEGDSTRPQPIVTTEDLGIQTVQSLPVSDVRTTTIVPAGRSGNDAPITKTQEVWTSPELKLVMKEQWNDPRSGERTIELNNFSQAEPDPALFHPPQGYEVKSALESLKELEEKMSAAQN
jgi:hypothetical protein